MKVLLLPFRAGQVLTEHSTPHDAILHVLGRRGQITLGTPQHEAHVCIIKRPAESKAEWSE